MFSFKKSKKVLNMIIEDYVLRIVETNGNNLSSIKLLKEIAVPSGLIEQGRISNEIEFYTFMNDLVKELNIKNRQIQFNVPNSIIIMRHVDIPFNLTDEEVMNHIEGELGRSIHLPFQDPIIDLVHFEEQPSGTESETRQVTIFAAPGEELRKYTEIFDDVSLKPVAADAGILGDYRYLVYSNNINKEGVYLIVEFNKNSVHLGIFNENKIEFLRYEELDVTLNSPKWDEDLNKYQWEYAESREIIEGLLEDQINELDKIMNFYRYSLYKGEKSVTDIVLLGDHPDVDKVYQILKNSFEGLSIRHLGKHRTEKMPQEINLEFVPALGLALRGDMQHASRS